MTSIIKKYSCYEYEITEKLSNEYGFIWEYKIPMKDRYTPDIDSDEWYATKNEAEIAAKEKIDQLESGPDEPDYDAPTAEEMYQKAHEDRRKLRGY